MAIDAPWQAADITKSSFDDESGVNAKRWVVKAGVPRNPFALEQYNGRHLEFGSKDSFTQWQFSNLIKSPAKYSIAAGAGRILSLECSG